jgi:quercetin dioxygenase-like cupin family protein
VSAFAVVGELVPQQIWEGVAGRTLHSERVTFTVVELDPHAEVPEHQHENEQLGILVAGAMTFRIGGEVREITTPGVMWRILANVPHSVSVGPQGAVAVEAFSPVRSDWAGLPDAEPRPARWPG